MSYCSSLAGCPTPVRELLDGERMLHVGAIAASNTLCRAGHIAWVYEPCDGSDQNFSVVQASIRLLNYVSRSVAATWDTIHVTCVIIQQGSAEEQRVKVRSIAYALHPHKPS